MSLDPNVQEQEFLAATLKRASAGLTWREKLPDIAVDVGFVVAVTMLWRLSPPHAFVLWPAAVCLLVLAAATRVPFFTPLGFTVPTELAFVPLLFAIPLALVPEAVVLALLIARLPDVLRGTYNPSRLFLVIGNGWFAIGPAAVFALAHTAPRDAGPALLLAAFAAQILGDVIVSTLRVGVGIGASVAEQFRELWVYPIDAALATLGLIIAEDIHTEPIVVFAPLPMLTLLSVLARERQRRLEGMVELNTAYRGTALVLGDVIEADDGYTGTHSKSVVALAVELGDALGLGAERQRNLEFAALLHDVGKIAIPKAIINKPGKLDPHEWALVKTHPAEGQNMLNQIGGFMRDVGLIVRSHHERWDGAGYPDGLAAHAIPVEARIITICDSWNAMRTDRSYRQALPYEMAVAELTANAGRQFDPALVDVMIAIVTASRVAATSTVDPRARSLAVLEALAGTPALPS
jgi:HD-GYP domain-containing protein (c-di-GMP phosphodiesterase class II)